MTTKTKKADPREEPVAVWKPKEPEPSQDKFERLALKRMRTLKRTARLVANLAKYDHQDKQAEAICIAASNCCSMIEAAFDRNPREKEDPDKFSF